MSVDPAFIQAAHRFRSKTLRPDVTANWAAPEVQKVAARLMMLGLALFFVLLGVVNLDVGADEARLGLAAGERLGPLGQVFGYWAPDLWPAKVIPSHLLGRLEPLGHPTSSAIRWPAAIAAIAIGWMISRSTAQSLGLRPGILFGICWFGSMAIIDRSSATGLDLIVGLTTLASIDRLMTRGSDRVAGSWAALAFLAGGWPPLLILALTIIVIGKSNTKFSPGLVLPVVSVATIWSFWAVWTTSVQVWAAALTLPFTHKPAWTLGAEVIALGLPWTPFAILLLFRSVRSSLKEQGNAWTLGWLQVALASVVSGTLVPGLSQPARVVALAGLLVVAATCLEAAWARILDRSSRRVFFGLFGGLLGLWLIVMLYGGFICIVAMPFYRPIGITMVITTIGVTILGWSALETRNTRRGLVTLIAIAVVIKLFHWGYYTPEANYRHSQGPWGRAIAQWVPKRWTLYTFHHWPADLAFFMKRPVRQLQSPQYLEYQSGPQTKFVLLQPSEFENWPKSAPTITVIAKFLDQSAQQRILAYTAGPLPPPLGPNPSAKLSVARSDELMPAESRSRR